MIKKILVFSLAFLSISTIHAALPVSKHIMTEWGENLDPHKIRDEYPRPIMERVEWKNLNGKWDYSILPQASKKPTIFEGEILVPFAVESALSGVGRTVGKDSVLWYQRVFDIPASWKGKEVMLNFGGVDWKTDVWVNDVMVGTHTGGYTPFTFNITKALQKGDNKLTLKVWDPTDNGTQPRGKQVTKPEGIWYTPVTGIWQTVWLEPMEKYHIVSMKIMPDIDNGTLTVTPDASNEGLVEVKVMDNGKQIAMGKSINNEAIIIHMPENFQTWSPSNPKLYDLEVTLFDNEGNIADKLKSYAAMRKFSKARDERGILRLRLNNEDLFQLGTLDQGWWPDGLYTAPTYEAMIYDIDKTKEWGFNMIRKHIKIEPATWYTYCDRKGIIVWQDMPSGDSGPEWQNHRYFDGVEKVRTHDSEAQYRKEWKEIIDCLHNYPCIAVWVPFNEAWGQFKTPEITEWTKNYDPSRLVNPASGGNFYTCGDILDLHNYPGPAIYLYDAQRANVLGEYGGIGRIVDGHIWAPDHNWGYISFQTPEEATDLYVKYAKELKDLAEAGLSAAVYTQTTDVEMEVNGLMTYDRKVVKMNEDKVRKVNNELTSVLEKNCK